MRSMVEGAPERPIMRAPRGVSVSHVICGETCRFPKPGYGCVCGSERPGSQLFAGNIQLDLTCSISTALRRGWRWSLTASVMTWVTGHNTMFNVMFGLNHAK